MRSRIRSGLIVIVASLALLAGLAYGLHRRYGGTRPYSDLTSAPAIPAESLEVVVSSPEPIGNVAVSSTGDVYYTVHPEARPPGAKLWHSTPHGSEPFPDAAEQTALFETPLGTVIDRQNRLWVIDPGRHGFGSPRLLAFSLLDGRKVFDLRFPPEVAPRGSFLQDLQVTGDGATVIAADASFWRRSPALVIVDVASRRSRRVLENDASVRPQPWLIRTPERPMTFIGGLISLQVGVDGLALSRDGRWLYYGAMNHTTLYRVPVAALTDAAMTPSALRASVEAVGRKPLNDGLSTDLDGNVLITDVEHGAILRMRPSGELETLVRTPRIRWADALSYGPDGWLYVADSAIPDLMLRSRHHIAEAAPYFIYRFRPGVPGIPGQ